MTPQQGYFYIIPAPLAEQGNWTKAGLYGLVTSLCNKNGECTAGNGFLAKKLGKKDESIIRRYLTELEKDGWVTTENRGGKNRIIRLNVRFKPQEGAEKTAGQRAVKTAQSNTPDSNRKSNTPLPPKGEKGFEEFWAAYPRKAAKKKAKSSWLKLKVGEEIFGKIIASLKAHKASDQWQKDRGAYIPHPATWLNQERWNDELEAEIVDARSAYPQEPEQLPESTPEERARGLAKLAEARKQLAESKVMPSTVIRRSTSSRMG